MPVEPNFVERLALFRFNRGPSSMLDLFGAGGFRAAVAFIGLTYRITLGRSVHDADAVADWLRDAGFQDVERTGLRRDPGSELLQATRD